MLVFVLLWYLNLITGWERQIVRVLLCLLIFSLEVLGSILIRFMVRLLWWGRNALGRSMLWLRRWFWLLMAPCSSYWQEGSNSTLTWCDCTPSTTASWTTAANTKNSSSYSNSTTTPSQTKQSCANNPIKTSHPTNS